ncbi:dynactin subunit 1-like [Zootermopsis nevadensis]|uniref:dynactin subunit 1-like n=1 Tax=Zootermopsis nevadensis TaxID=136037 RepID=UPI000B8EB80B|nr:dynactin subunit 1-like [Zootermopsis nevadensis]
MRDLSAHEKHEFQKLQKDLDLRKSEIAELARTKEKLSSRVEEMDNQISDLQEQTQREKEAALETLADREITIAKFCELVQQSQELHS